METQPLQRCDNCRKEFPESKMATHFGYCRRNIKKCEICQEMIDINSKQEHEEQYHKKEQCPHCKKIFPSNDLKKHDRVCDSKPKYCQYCDLNVPVASYATHLKACESRTKPCTKCDKPIMNKDYLVHLVSCTGPVEVPKSYQEHIIQQQKKFQVSNPTNNYGNPREKVVINGNGGSANYIREDNKYANIIPNGRDKTNIIQHKITYGPRPVHEQRLPHDLKPNYEEKPLYEVKPRNQYKSGINQPKFKVEDKKQTTEKFSLKPSRRDETGKIVPSSIEPNGREVKGKEDYKKQAYMVPRSGINHQGGTGSYDATRKNANSREGSHGPVSNKMIYGQPQPVPIKGPSIKETKSVQKVIGNNIRKDIQQGKSQFRNPTYVKNPAMIQKPHDKNYQLPPNRAPEKPKVTPLPPMKPSFDQPYGYDSYEQTNGYEISAEEKQMQQIIEQSLKEQKGAKPYISKPYKTSQYTKDTTDFGEDMFNESFIAKQKAIEEQLSRHNKPRR